MWAHVEGRQRQPWMPTLTFYLVWDRLVLGLMSSPPPLHMPGSQGLWSLHPTSLQGLGLQAHMPTWGGLRPDACAASTLSSEPSPQPQTTFLLRVFPGKPVFILAHTVILLVHGTLVSVFLLWLCHVPRSTELSTTYVHNWTWWIKHELQRQSKYSF